MSISGPPGARFYAVGERSPDGLWEWNGRQWVPAPSKMAGTSLIRHVPGFRSGTVWKRVLACSGYGLGGLILVGGIGSAAGLGGSNKVAAPIAQATYSPAPTDAPAAAQTAPTMPEPTPAPTQVPTPRPTLVVTPAPTPRNVANIPPRTREDLVALAQHGIPSQVHVVETKSVGLDSCPQQSVKATVPDFVANSHEFVLNDMLAYASTIKGFEGCGTYINLYHDGEDTSEYETVGHFECILDVDKHDVQIDIEAVPGSPRVGYALSY